MQFTAKARSPKRVVARGASIPAPVGGWDAISPLANMKPDRAVTLDNWFPQPGYVELRRGFSPYVDTLSEFPVESLMAYQGPIASTMFATSNDTVFNVGVAGLPTVAITGLANARFQHINFNTSGGDYLWICNGADTPRYFDGAAWTATVITGIDPSDIIHVAAHKARLWLALVDSLDAAYLPVDSIQGAATLFPLSGVFAMGGYLMAIGTWTLDGGNGPDDYIAFVSSRGQVALYSGVDPAVNFGLVGVFNLGAPLGRRCLLKIGTDLALISIDGVLPLSQSLVLDRAALARAALTTNIQRVMNQSARDYQDNFGWQLISYPKGTAAILNVPLIQGTTQYQYVMNTITGAWCRFLGQNANCWETFNDRLFFGGNDGAVYEADVSGSDNGVSIDADMRQAFNYFGKRGNLKRWTMCRPLLTTDGQVNPAIALNVDFSDDAEISAPAAIVTPSALWDLAVWDAASWPVTNRVIANWVSIFGLGYCASIRLAVQVQGSGLRQSLWDAALWDSSNWDGSQAEPVTLQLNGYDILMEDGAFL